MKKNKSPEVEDKNVNKDDENFDEKKKKIIKDISEVEIKDKIYDKKSIELENEIEEDEESGSINYDLGKKLYRFNVLLVGDCSVGKTSIINRYINGIFNKNIKNTVNIEFQVKSINLKNDTVVDLKIWDTCGSEKFRSVTKNFYRNSDGIFLVFDLKSFDSFSDIPLFLSDIQDICDIKTKCIMLIGNKSDIPSDIIDVKENDVEQFLKKNKKIKYLSVSAKNGDNIKQMFVQMSEMIVENMNKNDEGVENDKDKSIKIDIKKVQKGNKNKKTKKDDQNDSKCC